VQLTEEDLAPFKEVAQAVIDELNLRSSPPLTLKEAAKAFRLGLRNFAGIGIGEKVRRGAPYGHPAIRAYVIRKAPLSAVDPAFEVAALVRRIVAKVAPRVLSMPEIPPSRTGLELLRDEPSGIPRHRVSLDLLRDAAPQLEELRPLILPPKSAARHRTWWVNQGQSFSDELLGGYLVAPLHSKDGRIFQHHTNLAKLRVGDGILHYARGSIVAVSRVTDVPKGQVRNRARNAETLGTSETLRASVDVRRLDKPVPLNTIPLAMRIWEGGAFTRRGSVNQGYLYLLSQGFLNGWLRPAPDLAVRPDQRHFFETAFDLWRTDPVADVVDMRTSTTFDHQNREFRPRIPGGAAIGTVVAGRFGTLGAWLQCRGRTMLLTCSHCLDPTKDPPIVKQPAGGGQVATIIARVCPPTVVSGSTIDAALAEAQAQFCSERIREIGEVYGTRRLRRTFGSPVYKSGAASHKTAGQVVDLAASMWLTDGQQNQIFYEGQLQVQGVASRFARDGDSGAVLIDDDGYVVGLLIGGQAHANQFIATPIQPVLRALAENAGLRSLQFVTEN